MFKKSVGLGLNDLKLYGNLGPLSINSNGDVGVGFDIPGTNFRLIKNVNNISDPVINRKNKLKAVNFNVYLFLTIFLGIFGIHKFYIKKYFIGIIYMLTFGLIFIGYFIDLIKLVKIYKVVKENKIKYLYV